MKIGILGSGDVAKSLAKGFMQNEHMILIGSGHEEKLNEFAKENPGVKLGTFEEAADFGDIVVLSVKGIAAEELVEKLKDKLANKTIIDTTNPIADAPPQNGVLKFFTDLNMSLMERLQKFAPEARFVKAFNCVGASAMVNPDFGGMMPTMFICGIDQSSKNDVSKVLNSFGWETEDMGGIEASRAIEPLCMLWCIPGFAKNDWHHAFKMLRK